MRLKSVRIYGFKTFAERTEFSLEGGIVAVVGPNGCGKSNLVDAILWGLGEGNARHLRAQTSQDVIFNGSAKRKGVGFCEVVLNFDNEDGVLPVPSPEVTVARRLARNGDSDYSINRRNCRQRDVIELLADSGLGRTGYSIVGQKQIDGALSASNEERRAWIDEAAGVQRYRQRKVEAMRKLDAARDHLQRVADILAELESQREPLREQAEQAAQYRRVQSALKETEVSFLGYEISTAASEQVRMQEQIDVAAKLVESETFRARAYEARIAEIQRECSEIDGSISQERTKAEGARNRVLNAEAEIRIQESKLEALGNQESSLAADRVELEQRIQEAEADLERTQKEFREEEEQANDVRSATAGYGEETRTLALALDQTERELKAANQREAQRVRRQTERQHHLEKRALASRELNSLQSHFGDLEKSVEEAKAEVEKAAQELEGLRESSKSLLSEDLNLKASEDRESSLVRTVLSERAALEGRERGIEATIDSLEGMAQGSRAVLEAAARNQIHGHFVPVGYAIQTHKDHALAIETALGGAVNDLIVESERESKDAIEYLKAHRAGRATFQPIGLMRPMEASFDLRSHLNKPGVLGVASNLVTCEPKYLPVIESLLARILVVDSLNTALKLAKTKGWSRIVTLEGEIIFSSGAVTGGAQARHGYGVLQRKADLAAIRKQIDEITDQVDEFHRNSKIRQTKSQEIAERVKNNRIQIQEHEEAVSEAKSFFRALDDELKSTVRERDRLQKELAAELPEEELESEDIAHFEGARDFALKALAAKSADAQLAEERLRESEKRLSQARQRVEKSIQRRDQAVHAEAALARKADSVQPEKERINHHIVNLGKLRDEAKADDETARKSLEFLNALRASRNQEREKEEAAIAQSRQTLSDTGQLLHQAEINRTRAEARRLNALAKLAEEYNLVESDVEAMSPNPPAADAPMVIARLRREIRAMGDVNLGAIEAFERLSLRFDELSEQSADILGGIEEVEKSVKELDQLTREKFLDTFTLVQKMFAETFEKLFPTGFGNIRLTEPEEVLTSGIEIEVTLPGKKRQALSLLSGGEQSLCTTAFLFSLLQVKPSPLVVLDEVDAPLDGRNVERYAALLQELAQKMQFIVITHNPVTIEAATTWLGVTMQEPGISTLLPTNVPSTLHPSAKSA